MTFYREHARFYSSVSGESRTKQSFKDECDINNILRKYQKTGLLTHVASYAGRYEELPSDVDYQESLNAIISAEAAFMSLPSGLRLRFGNDPGEFLQFVSNPANSNELVELGLAKPRPSAEQRGGASSSDADPAAPVAPANS